MADGIVTIDTELDTRGAKSGMSKLGSGLKTGAKVATTAITAVAGAVVAVGAASIKVGSEFQTSFAKASTLFGDVNVDVENLKDNILDLSSKTGVSADELNEALYSALSAGIPVTEDMAEATEFLEKSTKLAKAGFTDTDTAINAVAKTLNAYGMDVSETDRIQKILMQTQNNGITTVDQLGTTLANVTPTAASFGVSFEQVGAALAGITAAGTETSVATNQLKSLIAELGKSGTIASNNLAKAAESTEYAGMSFKQMQEAGLNLNDILNIMQAEADASGKELLEMFSSVEAGNAAVGIATSDFEKNMDAMTTSTDVVGEAFEKMDATFASQVAKLKESTKNLGIEIFDALGEPATALVRNVTGTVQQLTTAFKEEGASGFVTALGGIITDMLASAGEYAPMLIELALELIETLLQGITDSLPQIVESSINIMNTFVESLVSLAPMLLQAGLDLIVELALGLAEALPELVPTIVDIVLNIAETLIDNLDVIIDAGIQLIIGLAIGLVKAIPKLVAKVPKIITSLLKAVIAGAGQLVKGGIELVLEIGKGLIEAIPDLVASIPDIIEAVITTFTSGFALVWEIGENVVKGIWEGILGAKDWIINKLSGWCSELVGSVKGLFGIQSPSKVMKNEVGKYLAEGVVVGFTTEDPMKQINADLQNGITQLDTSMNYSNSLSNLINYEKMANTMVYALDKSGLGVYVGGREFGRIVKSEVYA